MRLTCERARGVTSLQQLERFSVHDVDEQRARIKVVWIALAGVSLLRPLVQPD